jgi:pimeloyl-ACP methyl ester carboxylesterase
VASPSRRRWWLAGAAAAIAVTAALLPPVQARVKGLAVLAEAVGLPYPRPLAPLVRRFDASFGDVTGHVYVPDGPAPAVVLLPGAAPLGKNDPRAVRLAVAMARAGRIVLIPDLTLARRRFDFRDLDRVVSSVLALDGHPLVQGPVSILGISYGGSFALVAAADPRLAGRVAQVAVFGAYWDLVGVIQAVTTGVTVVGGRAIPWEGHPIAREILEEQALALAPEGSRDALQAAMEGNADPESLDPAARALYELLENRDPGRTAELADRLAPGAREVLARFSPASVADGIRAPVIAMHARGDPAVPYAESLRLARGLPQARVVKVGSFRHVDFQGSGPWAWVEGAGDLWSAWRFASWLLEAQE